MPPFLYSCPTTGQTVQGFVAKEVPSDAYQAVEEKCQLAALITSAHT